MGQLDRRPYDVMANKARNSVDNSRRSDPVEELRQQEAHKKDMMRMAIEDIEFIVSKLDAATSTH
jgi:predicted N-acetyltransferase YhbS